MRPAGLGVGPREASRRAAVASTRARRDVGRDPAARHPRAAPAAWPAAGSGGPRGGHRPGARGAARPRSGPRRPAPRDQCVAGVGRMGGGGRRALPLRPRHAARRGPAIVGLQDGDTHGAGGRPRPPGDGRRRGLRRRRRALLRPGAHRPGAPAAAFRRGLRGPSVPGHVRRGVPRQLDGCDLRRSSRRQRSGRLGHRGRSEPAGVPAAGRRPEHVRRPRVPELLGNAADYVASARAHAEAADRPFDIPLP